MSAKKKPVDAELLQLQRAREAEERRQAESFIRQQTRTVPVSVLNGSVQKAQHWKCVAAKALAAISGGTRATTANVIGYADALKAASE